jgi:hypothetical protein
MKKTRGIVLRPKLPSLSQGDGLIAMNHWRRYLVHIGSYGD